MTCRELTDFLDAWVHDELPAAQKKELDAHMGECPECVHYAKSYKRTVEMGCRAFECPTDAIPEQVPEALVKAVLAARKKR